MVDPPRSMAAMKVPYWAGSLSTRDVVEILRRSPQQRNAADVDLLDRFRSASHHRARRSTPNG